MSKGKPSRPLRGRREIRSSPVRVGEIRVPLRKKDRTGKTAILIFLKNFQKPLDKSVPACYNTSTVEDTEKIGERLGRIRRSLSTS